MAVNKKKYINKFLKIRDKAGKIVSFEFNEGQEHIYGQIKELHKQGKPIRLIVLKARQMGISTEISGLFYTDTATKFNVRSLQVAHNLESSKMLFKMIKLYDAKLPTEIRPSQIASNAKEIIYDTKQGDGLNSIYTIATAGTGGLGRGGTINNLHLSEYAFYPGNIAELKKGLFQSVPYLPNTCIMIESTANGFNHFKDEWDNAVAGKSDFVPIFLAWHTGKEYRKAYSGFKLTKKEEDMKERFKLDNDQLEWRRHKIANDFSGDVKDFEQEYPSTPEEAFRSTGDCVFNRDKLHERLQQVPLPIKVGEFIYRHEFYSNGHIGLKDIQFVEREDGYIKIYEEPKDGQYYVIGGDTAGDGSDEFVGQCIELNSGKQMFTFSHLNDEDYYAEQMYCLGKMYKWATIGIETNFSTHPIKQLVRMDYPNQFIRRNEDKAYDDVKMSYGVLTTKLTRPLFISSLKGIVNNHVELLKDEDTLREMLSFIRNKKTNGKIKDEAQQGRHDDKVLALGIAYYIRGEELV